jgi:serine/threonine protein kinase
VGLRTLANGLVRDLQLSAGTGCVMAQLATADTLSSSPPRATIVGGRYSLDHLIAEGGMALIYRGRHLELDQTVAIKLVLPELAFDVEATARFLNEARTIAKLRSPHVCRVLDSGCSEPGRPFMVLEYLEGGDLRKLLDVNSTVPVDTAVGMVLEAAEALAEAHAHGIVHRDIKPENLFLARMADGTVTLKVIDFGICKHQNPGSRCFTLRGKTLGSPHYMAPEQITSPEEVDERADIWALGVVLYELLSGYQPFVGETLTRLCAHVVHSPPRKPLRKCNPDVPAALERVVLRCLSKQPSERYASVVELAGALAPFCTRGGELMERIRRMSGQENVVLRSLTPLALNMESRHFRPGRRWVGPTLSALAIAAGLTLLVTRNSEANSAFHTLLGHATRLVQLPSPVADANPPSPVVVDAVAASPALAPAPTVEVLARAQVAIADPNTAPGTDAPGADAPGADAPRTQAAELPVSDQRELKTAAVVPRPAKLVRAPLQRVSKAEPVPRWSKIQRADIQRSELPPGDLQPAPGQGDRVDPRELMAPGADDRDTSELIAPYYGGS